MNNFPVPVLADLQAGTPKEARKSTLTERKRSFRGGEFNFAVSGGRLGLPTMQSMQVRNNGTTT